MERLKLLCPDDKMQIICAEETLTQPESIERLG